MTQPSFQAGFILRLGGQLEDGAATGVAKIEIAAIARGAIEVALCVDDQFSVRICAVRISGEVPDYGFFTSFIHLEHGADAVGAAAVSGPVKITGLVQHQFSVGKFAIWRTGEAVQGLKHAAEAVYFVHATPVVIAAHWSHPEEFVEMIPDHTREGTRRVGGKIVPTVEAVDYCDVVVGELEDRSLVVGAAVKGGSVKDAIEVDDQGRFWECPVGAGEAVQFHFRSLS